MKPLFLKISIILCALFLWTGMSMATSTGILVGGSSNLTEYLQTAQNQPNGNNDSKDNEYNVNALVTGYNDSENPLELPIDDTNYFKLPENLTLLGKWEKGGWSTWEDDSISKFTGTFTGDDGDWSIGDTSWDKSLYYSLKAANDFALYYANGETNGDWEITWKNNGGQIPTLSHISFWTAGGNSNNQVPEPATLALVGLGLAGIAGYRRKRHSS